MPWIQLAVTTSRPYSDATEDCLLHAGALTVTLSDASDQPILEPAPGETPMWEQLVITGLFDASTDTDTLRAQLQHCLPDPGARLALSTLDDQDWTRAWMTHYKPMAFGPRLWVCPWHIDPPEADAVNLRLDPGLAFGTGTHPTTALCLRWLDENLDARALPARMLDFGCGSGILAIAACLLGVARADCVDIDPQALQATADNARANQVESRIQTFLPEAFAKQAGRPYPLVMANILSGPLAELAPQLARLTAPGGDIVLSGLLAEQSDALLQIYAQWFTMSAVRHDGDWRLLHGQRNDTPAEPPA